MGMGKRHSIDIVDIKKKDILQGNVYFKSLQEHKALVALAQYQCEVNQVWGNIFVTTEMQRWHKIDDQS